MDISVIKSSGSVKLRRKRCVGNPHPSPELSKITSVFAVHELKNRGFMFHNCFQKPKRRNRLLSVIFGF